ncbi:MAG: YfiR family protein, partial [Ignavibacteriales bacterium]|nr:YfiR family protein [Ignavibacteriales bacterium]
MNEPQHTDLKRHQYTVQRRNILISFRYGCLYFFTFVILLMPPVRSVFSSEKVSGDNIESQVKAAYIYNFTKFVYWKSPDIKQKNNPINIWVLGSDP